jgi:caa(3)-type oxidase subunit IV
MSGRPRSGAGGRGWRVLGTLAVLTAIEFVFAVVLDANVPVLAVIAVVKAAIIMHYFMHVSRVWRGAEEEA